METKKKFRILWGNVIVTAALCVISVSAVLWIGLGF